MQLSPIPDPRRLAVDREYQEAVEDLLEDMCVWICDSRPSGRQVSAESCKKYVSSVRAWYRRCYRATLGLGASGSRIADVLKGYARLVDQPPKLEREGCLPAQLEAGMQVALRALPVLERLMWRAALTFAVTVLARGVEFALDAGRGEVFEETEHMTARDVRAAWAGGRRHAAVRMRKRKNLLVLRGKTHTVFVASSGGAGHFDAAAALFEWLDARRAAGIGEGRPLFCHVSGAALTVAEVRDMVKRVMAAAGCNPALYGAHSLRIGGATAALAAGVPPNAIRLMGRWSSDVYEIYCRISLQSAVGVGEAIASATVSPAGEAFHEEALEFLPSEVAQVGRDHLDDIPEGEDPL